MVRLAWYLVEQNEAWKNRSKVSDSFDFNFNIKLIEPDILRNLYQTQGLSAAQVATKLDSSKSSIFTVIHQLGLRCESK